MIYTHSDALIKASRNVHGLSDSLPFDIQLLLQGQQENLQCEEIFRVLPGRRITLRAVLNDTAVVVKLYLGADQKRYWQRELTGLNILANSTLQTPHLLHSESNPKSGLSYLVLECVTFPAVDKVPGPRQKVYELSSVLAQMHNEGIVQKDLHLENFLFGDKGIYLIDGDAIRGSTTAISTRRALENMSVLLAQLNIGNAATSRKCLLVYLQKRESSIPIDHSVFHRRVEKLRLKRLDKLLEKAQRSCTEYYSSSDMRHFLVCSRKSFNTDLQTLLADLDGWVERGECLKDGNTCTVSRVHINDQFYVVKRYNIKSLWHGFGRAFRTTRARLSWLNSQTLNFYGIPTAQVYALFEERRGPLRGRAFLIMENLEGTLLSTQLQPLTVDIRKLVFSVFQKLFNAGLVHGDTKSSNFIVLNKTPVHPETALAVIDLDAMKRFKKPSSPTGEKLFRKVFNKDVKRFIKNFNANPELAAELSGEALSVTPADCSV